MVSRVHSDSDVPILDVADVVELEQMIARMGTDLSTLMDRAGKSVSDLVNEQFSSDSKILVFAGSGNNGGDGWVAALDLSRKGFEVCLITTKPAQSLKAEPARTAALEVMNALQNEPVKLHVSVLPELGELKENLATVDCVIDALLGTGFEGQSLRAPLDEWISLINERPSGYCVVAVDVPSGLSAQSGIAASPSVEADETVTMLAMKPGLLGERVRRYVGDLYYADLGCSSLITELLDEESKSNEEVP